MNIKVNTMGGGAFSLFMVGIQSLLSVDDIDSIENIYIGVKRGNGVNPFDYVLEQNINQKFNKTIDAMSHHKSEYGGIHTNIFGSDYLEKLKKICKKIKIKNHILDMVKSVGDDCLGIHIRLTDMNSVHPNHGKFTIDNYIPKIKTVLDGNPTLNSIFIASDNDESITKITPLFSDYKIIWNNVSNRSPKENNPAYINYQRRSLSNEMFWVDSFLEMLSLSMCSELIYRVSNLNNASVIFSNTIKKVHKL